MRPYFEQDGIQLFLGDCREIMPALDLSAVDLLLTDPPNGIDLDTDYSGGKFKDGNSHRAVHGDIGPFDPTHLLCFRRLILWGGNCYANRLPDSPVWLAWDKITRNDLNVRIAECEFAWTNCVSRSRVFRHLWSGGYRASEQRDSFHPCQKPVRLMQWCIGLVPDAKTILDPYMGAGSVVIAANNLGRNCIGIEIDEKYCEIAARRLSQQVLPLEVAV